MEYPYPDKYPNALRGRLEYVAVIGDSGQVESRSMWVNHPDGEHTCIATWDTEDNLVQSDIPALRDLEQDAIDASEACRDAMRVEHMGCVESERREDKWREFSDGVDR